MRKRLSTILLLAGCGALLWCATVWISAALFQKYQAWIWNTRPKATQQPGAPAAHSAAPPAKTQARPKPHDVIAWLEIPRLGISTAVLEGDDAVALRLGAGHVPWTPLPGANGNVGIAAHRDTYFRPLAGIVAQDRILLRTPRGEREYEVESTRIVKPSNVGVLADSGQSELTLVTCYPFKYVGSAPLRFIVRAHSTNGVAVARADPGKQGPIMRGQIIPGQIIAAPSDAE